MYAQCSAYFFRPMNNIQRQLFLPSYIFAQLSNSYFLKQNFKKFQNFQYYAVLAPPFFPALDYMWHRYTQVYV